MDPLQKRGAPQAPLSSSRSLQEICNYCGNSLQQEFYFCTFCATPYKNPNHIFPAPQPLLKTTEELIHQNAPSVHSIFWTYAIVIIGTSLSTQYLFSGSPIEFLLFFQTACLFLTTCIFSLIHRNDLIPQLKTTGLFHSSSLIGFLSLIPLLFLNYNYHSWLFSLLETTDGMQLARLRQTGISEINLILLFCLFPAITEEIAFRGLLQTWLQNTLPSQQAVVIASALFAAMHFSIYSAPYLFLVGMVLGWTRFRTNSLYPSIVIHFLHNFCVIQWFNL